MTNSKHILIVEDDEPFRRMLVVFEWIWTCLFPPDIAHLSLSRTSLIRPAGPEHSEVSARDQ